MIRENATQKTKVIDKILADNYVDNFWAINNYILRLGAIIHQLTKEGWEFSGKFGIDKDRKNYFYYVTKVPEPPKLFD